jgi:CHAT domain-containing protein
MILEKGRTEDIAASLPENGAGLSFLKYTLVEFHEGEKKTIRYTPSYAVFILFQDGKVRRIELGPEDPIDQAVTVWRTALYDIKSLSKGGDDLEKAGETVYRLVWRPLEEALEGVKQLVLAPDALLCTVPLEALPCDTGRLADAYVISYNDAFSTLAMVEKKPHLEQGGLVAFGGVDFDREPGIYKSGASSAEIASPLACHGGVRTSPRGGHSDRARPLEGSLEEAREVSELFDTVFRDANFLVKGAHASKRSLIALAPKAKYFHIATHGYFAPEETKSILDSKPPKDGQHALDGISGLAPSLLCGLKLAGYNLPRAGLEDEGAITAEEIQGLDLAGCELAVLSACESNVGLVRTGMGIMSMQRALGIAGAGGSITSLWKVDDKATRKFFTAFYRYLWIDKMTPPVALQRVKLDMIHGEILPDEGDRIRTPSGLLSPLVDYSAPYFWAGFVYWGKVR